MKGESLKRIQEMLNDTTRGRSSLSQPFPEFRLWLLMLKMICVDNCTTHRFLIKKNALSVNFLDGLFPTLTPSWEKCHSYGMISTNEGKD